jgi:hypothetical protein
MSKENKPIPQGFEEKITEAELKVALFDYVQELDYEKAKELWQFISETNPTTALKAVIKVKSLKGKSKDL